MMPIVIITRFTKRYGRACGQENWMRISKEQVAENHERILDAAGKLFRERGFDGTGVDDLMKEAGLTHGAFYRHFDSKESLAADVCVDTLAKTVATWSAIADSEADGGFEAFIRSYLSLEHRDNPGDGCPVSSLGPHIAHQPEPVKQAFADGLQPMIEFLMHHTEGSSRAVRRALALRKLSSLVGALVLARAVQHERLSEEILQANRATM
jgi:TetR/AcrR family transcriptional repressor of nem operon